MVARDLRPAAIVEGHGFKDLMKYIEPGYRVLTAMHTSEVVRKKHVAAKECLKMKLQDAKSLVMTTDIWTSCANDAYFSVTAHFITDGWKMVSCVLGTYPFPGYHTAINIVDKLMEVIQDYDLTMGRVKALIHDHASNMELTG